MYTNTFFMTYIVSPSKKARPIAPSDGAVSSPQGPEGYKKYCITFSSSFVVTISRIFCWNFMFTYIAKFLCII